MPRSDLRAPLAAGLLACVACASGPGRVAYDEIAPLPESEGPLLTLLHLFESGRQNVERYLDAGGAEGEALRATIEQASRSVVRVHVRTRFEGSSYSSANGSGVLLAGGRFVLSAGHVVETLRAPGDARVSVTLVDGTELRASAPEWDYAEYGGAARDWAVLELAEPLPAGFEGLAMAAPRADATVLALGYPDHVGIDGDGRLAYDLDERALALLPQALIGRVANAGAVVVTPLVGCVPEGGMSGGPIVDQEGRVVAILTAVSRSRVGDGVRFEVEAAPLERARKWVTERVPR